MGGLFTSPGQLALEDRLATLIAQRAVLADQVSNIDTPGYQPAGDAAFAQALAQAAAAGLGAPLSPTVSTQGALGGPPATAGVLLSAPASSPPASAYGSPGSPAVPGFATAGSLAAGPNLAATSATAGAVTPDANGVDLEAAMVGLAQTDLDYQAVARQLQLVYQNLQTAIDAGGA